MLRSNTAIHENVLNNYYPQVAAYAAEAIQRAGLPKESIRGGTDGSRFSYIGMPLPQYFTGMQNIHSKLEWDWYQKTWPKLRKPLCM